MVNLSIDPPPFFGRGGPSRPRLGRLLVYPLLLIVAAAGGFVAGRRTAHRALPFLDARKPEVAAPVQPAPPPPAAPAQAGRPAASGAAPAVATPAQAAPAQAASAAAPTAPAAAAPAVPPGAPQGPLVRRINITLRGSLEESVAAALAPADRPWGDQLTQVVNRILVWSLQIARDGRKGDQIDVLFELPSAVPTEVVKIGDGGPLGKEPVVLALRYGSQKLGRMITAYRFKPEGAAFARYFTAEGVDVEDHLVDGPISDYEQVTSLLRDGRRHKGVDFKAPVGTPVRAPFDGEVTRRNWHFSANGNCLEILDSRTSRRALFLHLEAAPKEMQPGRKVKKGEVIARSGNSGHSTAPHLHYQLEAPGGRVLDPYAIHATRKVALEGAAKSAFERERSKLDPMLVAGR